MKDHKRACGGYKPGGSYLEADMSPGGTLNAATSLAGAARRDGSQILCELNPQGLLIVDAAATMNEEVLIFPEDGYDKGKDGYVLYRSKVGAPLALVDHVGASYYTPHTFTKETVMWGPSRKVPARIAAQIANFTPIPIFFAHSAIPLFEDQAQYDRWSYLAQMVLPVPVGPNLLPVELRIDCSYKYHDWGMAVGMDNGMGNVLHMILEFIDLVEMFKSGDDMSHIHPQRALEDDFWPEAARELDFVGFAEQMFLASWITKVIHVANADGTVNPDVVNSPVQVVSLEDMD